MTSVSNPNAGTVVTATATCAAGKVLLGGGARVTASGQPERIDGTASYPSSTTVWTAIGVVDSNMSGSNTMTVQAYAICSL